MDIRTLRSIPIVALIVIAGVGVHLQDVDSVTVNRNEAERKIVRDIRVPPGFQRLATGAAAPFTRWLAERPLLPGRPPVRLFDGSLKANQEAHFAVLDIDVGERDLQQCADATIRLRAEYLWQSACRDGIEFRFTSGDVARWSDWQKGLRPRVQGSRVDWVRSGPPSYDYAAFRAYLDSVFLYAGTASLSRDLQKIADPRDVRPGDLFLEGGYPGHAVIVLDRVENEAGEARVLLAQSYMPAQQIHVLRRPGRPDDPWFPVEREGRLQTPEWKFRFGDAMRFPAGACDSAP